MQLYAGLPIITNKIAIEEQQSIPHHLLGCIGLDVPTLVVGTFVKKALGVIDEIRSRGKLPILVGGTHYYTQNLLFRENFGDLNDEKAESVEDIGETWPILNEPTPVVLEELKRVDPVMADRWHPNDRRKIKRSLELYLQTGRKASDVYAEQRKARNVNREPARCEEDLSRADESSMRSPTLLFWVHARDESLKERLNARVDGMVKQGLLDEVRTLDGFAQAQEKAGKPVDMTRGIWVSIGYKEFKPYTDALATGEFVDKQLDTIKADALERTKAATRQYAKRQLRWIRIKLVNALMQANASKKLYLLDGSDVSAFDTRVVESAVKLAGSFLTGSNPMPDPTSLSDAAAEMLTPTKDYDLAATPAKWMREHCSVCNVTCVTQEQWSQHMKSKAHRKLVSKRNKTALQGIVNENSHTSAQIQSANRADPT